MALNDVYAAVPKKSFSFSIPLFYLSWIIGFCADACNLDGLENKTLSVVSIQYPPIKKEGRHSFYQDKDLKMHPSYILKIDR